jgi:hypothetical protein
MYIKLILEVLLMKKFLCNILSLLFLGCAISNLFACNSPEKQTSSSTSSAPQNEIIEPISISLSISNLDLSKGETYQLYATISPSKADQTVAYRSLNENCATINSQGLMTAIDKGNTVIQAETINGLIATCNVVVSIPVGEVSGCMMYQNSSTSSSPTYTDSGAIIQLIPTNIKSFPDDYYPSASNDYENYGIYTTTTDSLGNYEFRNIPVNEYRLIVISKKADWHSSAILEHYNDFDAYIVKIYGEHIGSFVKKSSEKDTFKIWFSSDYATYATITVKENKATNKSITYKNWSAIL